MVQALACIAVGEFAQIQAGTKMLASAMQHRCFGVTWQRFKQIAQRQNQRIAQGTRSDTNH